MPRNKRNKILCINAMSPVSPEHGFLGRWKTTIPSRPLPMMATVTEKQGSKADIWDENMKGPITRRGELIYDTSDLMLVAFTGTTPQIPRVKELALKFREKGVKAVIGGPHVSSMNDEIRQEMLEYASLAIRDGEDIMEDGKSIYRGIVEDAKNGNLRDVYMGKTASLENMVIPDPKWMTRGILTTELSRGCYKATIEGPCNFCVVPKIHKYRRRPIGSFIKEVDGQRRAGTFTSGLLSKIQGSRVVLFLDDGYTDETDWTQEICEALIHYQEKYSGFKYRYFVQVGTKNLDNKGLLNLIARSGCVGMLIGVETTNQDTLNSINKAVNQVEEYKGIFDNIHSAGMVTLPSIILGFDEDTEESIRKTETFLDQTGGLAFQLSILTPYIGTKLYRTLQEAGRIITDDWRKYAGNLAVFRPANMTPQRLETLYKKFASHVNSYEAVMYRVAKVLPKLRRPDLDDMKGFLIKIGAPFVLSGTYRRLAHTYRLAPSEAKI